MKKKFWFFFTVTMVLFAVVLGMYFKYIHQNQYRVFIESFEHGVITVDSKETLGGDEKYSVLCQKGQELTLNINPERTDSTYYNLNKLCCSITYGDIFLFNVKVFCCNQIVNS